MNILLVDDHRIIRKALVPLLQDRFDATIAEAENGHQGVEIYENGPDHFDLIITDTRMPGMNGVEMVRKVLSLNSDQKIVIFSIYDDPETIQIISGLGVKGYVQKEFDISVLFKCISSCAIDIPVH